MHIQKDMTIYTAAELKPLLLAAATESANQNIDLSGVTEMDSAGLQLLILARREAANMGGELRFMNPSQTVCEVLNLVGLDEEFIARGTLGPATSDSAMTAKHGAPHES